jgi:hypothetical protein
MRRVVIAALVLAAGAAHAQPAAPDAVPAPAPRPPDPRDRPLKTLFGRPFPSARLFAMPAADTVGAYVLSLSGDGSLLQQPGLLTSAGVLAIGFGDLAQLEYRHTEAIGVTGLDAPVPAVGVQIKLPIPERPNVPAIGVAFRLGVPRREAIDGAPVAETVSDLYLVGRLRLAPIAWLTLHGGVRISDVEARPADGPAAQRTLWLPTAGYEVQMNPGAAIVGEIALAPRFQWAGRGNAPAIGHGLLGRLGLRWRVLPAVIIDGSLGYQLDDLAPAGRVDAVVSWDIRLGAEVFVPWGALACRAAGVFCSN